MQLALEDEKRLRLLRDDWQKKLQEAQTRLREQIEIYKKARQQRETLDELRKQQAEDYQREQLKSEQQERDELYLMRLRSRQVGRLCLSANGQTLPSDIFHRHF